MSLKLPADFAKKISEALGMTPLGVAELFEIEEDKTGFFVAKLKPKQFLEREQFKTMCALARDLGGEGYLQGMKAWKVPGACAKKSPEKSSETTEKEPSRVPSQPAAMDKAKLPIVTVPVAALLSMPFQARVEIEGPGFAELVESVKEHGVLDPVWVRPKPNGLYEVVAGDRRVSAAKAVGLVEVPVIVRVLQDEEAFILHLTENLQRKDLSEAEKSRALAEFARKYKLSAQQIADKLNMSYSWVTKYLPDEFKAEEKVQAGKAGGEAKAEAYRESQDFATRRVAESQDTRQGLPTIPCDRCGDPIQGPAIHAGNGRFYCTDCAEILKTEQPEPESSLEPAEEQSEPAEPKHRPEALLTGYSWTCPDCGAKFIINHVDWPGSEHKEHRLEACKE